MLFDMLRRRQSALAEEPLIRAPQALERFHVRKAVNGALALSLTNDREIAQGWLTEVGGALDGVIAKRLDRPYASASGP